MLLRYNLTKQSIVAYLKVAFMFSLKEKGFLL